LAPLDESLPGLAGASTFLDDGLGAISKPAVVGRESDERAHLGQYITALLVRVRSRYLRRKDWCHE
jgi:hypothetical protein